MYSYINRDVSVYSITTLSTTSGYMQPVNMYFTRKQ